MSRGNLIKISITHDTMRNILADGLKNAFLNYTFEQKYEILDVSYADRNFIITLAPRPEEDDQDDNPDPNALNPQTVILTLKDGRREEVAVADTFGAPNNPLSDDQNTAKFKNCCSFGAMPISQDKQLEVIKMLEDLENVTDISDLASLLAGVSTA